MTKQQLLNEIADILLVSKDTFCEDTQLDGIATWDSMSRMGILTLLSSELEMEVPFDFIGNVKTAKEILELAGDKLSA